MRKVEPTSPAFHVIKEVWWIKSTDLSDIYSRTFSFFFFLFLLLRSRALKACLILVLFSENCRVTYCWVSTTFQWPTKALFHLELARGYLLGSWSAKSNLQCPLNSTFFAPEFNCFYSLTRFIEICAFRETGSKGIQRMSNCCVMDRSSAFKQLSKHQFVWYVTPIHVPPCFERRLFISDLEYPHRFSVLM